MTIIIAGVRSGESTAYLDASQPSPIRASMAPILPPMQQIGGTCYAYAVARLCELNGFKDPSPAWINHHALALDRMDETEHEGSYAKSAIAAVVYTGLCTASVYAMRSLKQRKQPSARACISATLNRGWTATIGGYPRVITSHIHEEALTYEHGKSAPLSRQGAIVGSHVWVYLGVDPQSGHHTVQSSWGNWGGARGIAHITESYLNDSWDQWGMRWDAAQNVGS